MRCGDSTIWVEAGHDLAPSSLAADGSDFFLLGPSGPYPIIRAELYRSRWVKLELAQPLSNSDSLQLMVRTGRDSSRLLSLCGEAVSRDTLGLGVDCEPGPMGINASPEEKKWSLYPNPARDWVRIQVGVTGKKLEVYDGRGQLRYESKLLKKQTILPTEGWPAGYYWLRYQDQRRALLVQ